MRKILVIGSLNMDSVIETEHMPQLGETISGKSISLIPGGKGANQAYAAGKLGGSVAMIGAVGADSFGDTLKQNLASVNVDISGLSSLKDVPTGQAFIAVEETGENSIIIISGANARMTRGLIDQHRQLLEECDIVVMQLEIPIETVEYVKQLAVSMGKTVILDPAPAVSDLPDHFWQGIDYIKPNETELSILTGSKPETYEDLVEAARRMQRKGVKNVVVTLGEKGCMLVQQDNVRLFPAFKVNAVDTTAAGDSFTAAFALALSRGQSCEDAILLGQKVSSISVTRKGAQTSIPTMDEVIAMNREDL